MSPAEIENLLANSREHAADLLDAAEFIRNALAAGFYPPEGQDSIPTSLAARLVTRATAIQGNLGALV